MELIAIFILVALIAVILIKKPNPKDNALKEHPYKMKKGLFSPAERSFYGVLEAVIDDQYQVFGKIRIADVLTPEKSDSKKIWQVAFNKISAKHFDFVICDKETLSVKAAIELDDKSHQTKKVQNRDHFVNTAAESAGLKLIRFKAKKSYSQESVKKTIQEALNNPPNTTICPKGQSPDNAINR